MGRDRYSDDERYDDQSYDTRDRYDDEYGEDEGYTDEQYAQAGALVPLDESGRLPALANGAATGPVVIPGTGVTMGNPFIKRRERPLTLRIAVLTLMVCILVTGLFAVTPLGSSADSGISSFQALSGAVVLQKDVSYHLYTAQFGDTTKSIANAFHVEEGGIFELNDMLAGQEIAVGKVYKIPDDPYYGKDFRPASYITSTGNGTTTLGDSLWTSNAGTASNEATCGPAGDKTNLMGYQLGPVNPGAGWVRGFSWFHNGIDIAAPRGNPIIAAQAGEVIWAGWDVGGFGWSVKINHCNHVSTVYGHMDQLLVKAGDNVEQGDKVGLEGSTGWSTGPHLHFMVEWDNNPVDPLAYYGWDGSNLTKQPGS